jgi:hypothetical protein
MEWYWWVLLGVAVVVIATLKLKVFSMILEHRKKRQAQILEDE